MLASWWFAHLDCRIDLELAPTRIDGAGWNPLARDAAMAAVFGTVAVPRNVAVPPWAVTVLVMVPVSVGSA